MHSYTICRLTLGAYLKGKLKFTCTICTHTFTAPVKLPTVGSLRSLCTTTSRLSIAELLWSWPFDWLGNHVWLSTGGICWRGRMRGGNRCGIPSMMAWTLAAYVVTYDSSAYRSPISHGHLPAGYQQQPLGLTITVNTPTMSSGPLRQL